MNKWHRFLCKILGHKQEGPLPMGAFGEVRYYCVRCGMVVVIDIIKSNVSVKYPKDE